ncbi:MAG: D-alanine--D-alanine ligase [Clostridia bacterium]|nr:D-alanine--D-alanine ligase [Clostridia bacterium]
MAKMQLGVIFGSRTCEHEVSIISALQLMKAVDTQKYDVIPVYISMKGIWYTGEPLKEIKNFTPFNENMKGVQQVTLDLTPGSGALIAYQQGKGLFAGLKQVVVARLDCACLVFHGMHGEDGSIQGLMELANLPYTSPGIGSSAIGMDKIMMKQFFKGADLPVLDSQWYSVSQWKEAEEDILQRIEQGLGYPVFVKPANLGSSIGVSRADDKVALKEAMQVAFSFDRRVLVEKGLDAPIELNCSVVGYDGKCKASVLEMPNTGGAFLGFGEKYLQSGGGSKGMASLARLVPAPIEDSLRDEIQELAKEIFRLMDCKGVVRIDFMFDRATEKVYITEINTIPGSLAYYLWEHEGVKYSQLIDEMVDTAMAAHKDKNRHTYAFESDILKSVNLGSKGASKMGTKFGGKLKA